jgi:signal transduction histidine kinase/DNA-binding response OmpR family regulator/HAMP domain-containing protein
MNLSFRAKLLGLVATAGFALAALVAASAIIAQRVEGHLEDIRKHYLPKVGLRPQLQGQFERIQRAFQDAVAASDGDKLAATADLKKELLQQLTASSDAVEPGLAASLEQAVEDFYAQALAVSRLLIAGQTGESVVAKMGEMQARQTRVAELLDKATVFDKAELTKAFSATAEAQRFGTQLRLGLGIASLVLVFLLSLWISRDMLRGMASLTAGFRRFGRGDFQVVIPVVSRDELGDLASQANQMAQSLQRLESERSRVDWLKAGESALSEQLRGELEPQQVAERAISTLCRHLECPVGALYSLDADGALRLLGKHALSSAEGLQSFQLGEGLVGQAALRNEIMVIDAPQGQLQVTSALATGSPRSIVLVPLLRYGKVTGVLELASLQPLNPAATELLGSLRETIAIKVEAARSRAELRALLAKSQRQAEELTRAGAYKSQFLANMSHELRTPLNAILGFTQLLHEGEAGPLTEQQRDFLANVLTSSRHLLRLINDVLDLAKVESGKLDFRPESIDLSQAIGEVGAILRTTAAEKQVRVEIEVDPAIGRVVLDPARLKQVLYNYLSNALKFTPAGGVVTVRALPEGADFFRLEVHDTGAGIQPEDLRRLFVEFQQLDAGATKKHAGTGLGLALTKRIVEAQGGTVGVRSTPGAGSVFHAVLPRRMKGESVPTVARPIVTLNAGAPTILVVEDNASDQALIVQALTKAGYSVHTAATGGQALVRLREMDFDAITLDLLLPDMSGVDLLSQMRAESRNADVPVIVLTVVAEKGAVAGFRVTDVLAKPLDTAALLDALRRAGVSPERRGAVLVVDDDEGCLKLMEATLGRSGYETICRKDGAAALQAAAESPLIAVVLDLIMPHLDGFEFLERFRRTEAGRSTPVIVWTVKDLTKNDEARLRETAQAVVMKGNDGATALLRELDAFLPRRQVSG